MSILKKTTIVILSISAVFFVVVTAWIIFQFTRPPLAFIDYPIDDLAIIQDSTFSKQIIPETRNYHIMKFNHAETGEMTCYISFPGRQKSCESLPVLIILGGLEIGEHTLRYIEAPGNNVIIIYQYPYHPQYWYEGTAISEIPVIRASVLAVPAQVLALRQWIAHQSWADSTRINLAGYSFGSLFIPAIYGLSETHGIQFRHTVLAYGGVNINRILFTNMKNLARPFRDLVSWLAITAIRGIEPYFYVAAMKGDFLVINGSEDDQIPEASWRELHQLLPDPKTVLILEEGHMHPRKVELTRRLVRLSQDWLIQKNAINR